ncbi:MAG: YncE family protein [Mycobacteriales bacterium]
MRRLLVLLLLAGCSSGPTVHKAAEPAHSPPLTRTPAGRVVAVGHEAEGVAVDPRLHLAAVGVRSPYGLVLVDTRTGTVVRTVPLPGHVRHLGVQGDEVLVPVEDTGTLLRIALPAGDVLSSVPTDGYPHGVTGVGADAAVVGNQHGRRVTLVRGGVVATATGFPQPGGLAATPDGVYVVDVAASDLTRLRPSDLHRERQVGSGDGPTHVVADRRGDLVVVDTRGDRLLLFSPSLRLLRTVDLAGSPYGVAYDAVRDEVWVTLTGRNEGVGLRGGSLQELRRLPTVRQPNTVGVDVATGTVVVASRTDGTVELIPA